METGQLMAVKKVSLPETPPSSSKTAQGAALKAMKSVAQLEKEISVLNNLSHPNIVEYIGYKRTPKSLNIFLEYQPGKYFLKNFKPEFLI
jgi:serine/threonine protein kinase